MRPSIALSASGAPPRVADAGPAPLDVRDALLAPVAGRRFRLEITARQPLVVAGSRRLAARARELELAVEWVAEEGAHLAAGACVCRAVGLASQVARAEEQLLGFVGKASGVATAAAELVALARGRARIVCGAWKKVPAEVRADLRQAVALTGAGTRMLDRPFVYLDKNHVRMLGGVAPAVRHARSLEGRAVVVQLRGETGPIADEAEAAAGEGADLLMIDTGELADLAATAERVRTRLPAGTAVLAFGGGVTAATLPAVIAAGAEVVDVGRAILDAPLIDFRLDVK